MAKLDFVRFRDVDEGVLQSGDELRTFLKRTGIPRQVMTIFRAVESPYRSQCEGLQYEVNGLVIGLSREDAEICVALGDDRQVLLLAEWSPSRPSIINRDLSAFVQSLEALNDMLPLYGRDRNLDEAEDAADRVREKLAQIDPLSIRDPDGYWSAFLDDVSVGDYPFSDLS